MINLSFFIISFFAIVIFWIRILKNNKLQEQFITDLKNAQTKFKKR